MAAKLRLTALLLVALSSVSAQDKTAPAAQNSGKLCHDTDYLPSDAIPPRFLSHPDPVYIGQAFWAGMEPEVRLQVMVSTEGKAMEAEAEGVSAEVNQEAEELAKTWAWQPAMREGRPVAVPTTVRVKFRLQGNSANPYVYAPRRPELPPHSTDYSQYPLTIYLAGVGVGSTSSNSDIGGYQVMLNASFDPAREKAWFMLTCTGKNRGCSVPRSAEYPARWLTVGRKMEILGKTTDGDWRQVEYDYSTLEMSPPLTYPWSIF